MSDSEPINYHKIAFQYEPNKPAALTSGIVFSIVTVLLSIRLFRRRTWWGLCLPIGTFYFSAGFFLRYASALNPSNLGIFITKETLIVVSPAAFLAFNYIVYGRFIGAFVTGRGRYTLLRPQIVARVFIISDIVTFMVQGTGGGMAARAESEEAGRVILLIGIIVQSLSYVVFYVLLIHSHRAFCNDGKFDKYNFPWRLMHVLHFSSVFIIIRAAYRTAELGEGNGGYLYTHEAYFYALDTIPLFLATVVYIFYWPAQLIDDSRPQGPTEMSSLDRVNP